MKIVFLAPFGLRPKGTVIARLVPLAAALQDAGHSVLIVAPPYTNPEDSGATEIVRGVTIKNIALGPKNSALAAPILAWRMFRTALSEKPDLVHLFKPKGFGGLAAMLHICLQRAGWNLPPIFVDTDDWEGRGGMNDLHGYGAAEKMMFGFQERWLLPRAVGVTVASRTLQSQVWGMGNPPERTLYLPNCVEDAPAGNGAEIREKLGISPDAPVLLLYTRFFEFSQEKLCFVFAEILRQVPAVRFLVVGRGRNSEEDRLLQSGVELGFAPALVMAGWVEPGELPGYLAVADVAIYPFADTLINRSKCPAKLTELLRAGVPVVADRVGQLAEYIKPELSGILCDPDDWQEMSDRVTDLLLSHDRAHEIGKNGRIHLFEKFSWSFFADKLHNFYRELTIQ